MAAPLFLAGLFFIPHAEQTNEEHLNKRSKK
jgi:hypothetical protein